MSLVLFYRDCFTADKRIVSSHNLLAQPYHDRSKIFLSEDKRFAAMSCGMIPNQEQWLEIRDVIDLYKLDLEKGIDQSVAQDKTVEVLDKIVKSEWSTSTMVFALGDLFLKYEYSPDIKSSIASQNPNIPIVQGSGSFAANVLINSGRPISQEKFFKIVSYSQPDVTAEYEFIELKDVVDTPWFNKYHQKDNK